MKRVVILTALLMLALAGCSKPAGPVAVETMDVPAPSRPVNRLMPVESLPETTTTVEPVVDTREPATVETPAPAPARTYTLCKGDTLWSVALKFYGNGKRWKEIAQANNIDNPAKLRVGQVLNIPQ